MFKIRFLFLIFLSYSAYGLDIQYQYGVREIDFKSSGKVWSLDAPGKKLTIEEKKCNAELLKDFKDRLMKKLGQVPHHVPKGSSSKKAFEVIRYHISSNKDFYQTVPNSKAGQILLKLPDDFVALKLMAIKSCRP